MRPVKLQLSDFIDTLPTFGLGIACFGAAYHLCNAINGLVGSNGSYWIKLLLATLFCLLAMIFWVWVRKGVLNLKAEIISLQSKLETPPKKLLRRRHAHELSISDALTEIDPIQLATFLKHKDPSFRNKVFEYLKDEGIEFP